MKENSFILENEWLKVEILNPANKDDKHFSTRYVYGGYIVNIFDKKNNKNLLTRPKIEFSDFSGEGFPDEFEMPVGYDQARPNQLFLKVGVGRQEKLENKEYTNHDRHPVRRGAKIKVTETTNAIEFLATDSLEGFEYEYVKGITLNKNKLIINHNLKNKGKKQIDTLWYPHAFIDYDKENTSLILDIFDKYNKIFMTEKIKLCQEVKNGKCFYYDTKDNNISYTLKGDKTGFLTQMQGDFSLCQLQVFVNDRVVSVEPKLKLNLNTNCEKEWKTEYLFSY